MAKRQGISVDELLERLINERAASGGVTAKRPELPIWHLGAVSSLHRGEIYDDVP